VVDLLSKAKRREKGRNSANRLPDTLAVSRRDSDRLDTMPHEGNSISNLAGVVRLLKKEQERLTKEFLGIGAALAAFGNAYKKRTGKRKLSASARARIAAAQRARWAKFHENTGTNAKVVPIRGKRTLSAAGRKKIAAAQRAQGEPAAVALPSAEGLRAAGSGQSGASENWLAQFSA
jgi:hypothetical protein